MQTKLIASVLLLSVFSTAAFAGPRELYSDGEWKVEDMDKKNPNALCIASTTAEAGNVIYRLEFAKSKKLPGPAEVLIRVQGKAPGASSYTITLKDETVLAFANAGEVVPKKQHLLWNIPQHTERLIAQLIDRKDLKLKPADGSRDQRIEFSADGFKRVKEKMEEKCLNKAALYDFAFEEAFILKRDAINPLGITPVQVKELRRVLNAGYAIHLGILGTRDDLVKLQQRFQTQLNEKESLISRIEHLGAREIPGIIQNQQQNDALEANSRTQLQQTNVTISQQQSSLNAAQAQLNTARTVIAPYEAEHADRSSRAHSSRSAVNAGAQRLSEIDNGIRISEQRINQLSNEAGSLQNQTARLENDLQYARRAYAEAARDVQRFRPREEAERRLNQNRGYQQSRREEANIEGQMQVIRNGLNDARGKLLARETELRVCQTRTSFIQASPERIPAQERPNRDRPNREDRPNRPDRPTQPDTTPTQPTPPVVTQPTTPVEPTPTTPTAVDCTTEQNAVNAAKQVVASLESQHNVAEARLRDVKREVNRMENEARDQAQEIERDLRRRENQAGAQVASLENQRNSNINRVNEIAGREIPREQNNINSLSAERPSVQARYDQDVPVANRLESELASFERRVGWDAKVAAVQTAESLVSQRSQALNQSLSQKAALEGQISRCQSERSRLAQLLVDTQNRKLQAEARLEQVRQSLVPHDQEKARLEQQDSDLRNQLASRHRISNLNFLN
jgi:outer membrane murein-binding lipoprotein Lpp